MFWLLKRLVVLALLAGVAIWFLPAFGEPSPKAMSYSVSRVTDGELPPSVKRCTREDDQRPWRCWVDDPRESTPALYWVWMDGRRCWKARSPMIVRQGARAGSLPASAEGCVGLRDQVRVVERLFD